MSRRSGTTRVESSTEGRTSSTRVTRLEWTSADHVMSVTARVVTRYHASVARVSALATQPPLRCSHFLSLSPPSLSPSVRLSLFRCSISTGPPYQKNKAHAIKTNNNRMWVERDKPSYYFIATATRWHRRPRDVGHSDLVRVLCIYIGTILSDFPTRLSNHNGLLICKPPSKLRQPPQQQPLRLLRASAEVVIFPHSTLDMQLSTCG